MHSHVRFPGISFASREEFDAYRNNADDELGAQYRADRELATTAPSLTRGGTCAPCLRPAVFTSFTQGGDVLTDGRTVPNLREQFVCDCDDRLNARFRATLHFLESVVGISRLTRLLLFGPSTALDRRLRAVMPRTDRVPRLLPDRGGHRLPQQSESAHVAVALDVLHCVPPLDAALAEIRRVLVRGGQFVFTVPFRFSSASTRSHLADLPRREGQLPSECGHEVHELGWDLMDRLRAAGFRRCAAHAYRSEELGYLGTLTMLFSAEA